MPRGWCQTLLSGTLSQDSGHKLKDQKFQLNMSKNFFTLRVAEHWHRLPEKGMESLWRQTQLDMFLCHLFQVDLPWQGAGLADLQRPLPTLTILRICFKSHH